MRAIVAATFVAVYSVFVSATYPALAEDIAMQTWKVQEAHAPGDPVLLDLESESNVGLVQVQLRIDCVTGQTGMLLSFNRTLQAVGSDKRALIAHGFDSAEPDTELMDLTTGRKGAELRNEQAFPILRKMAHAKQWVVVAADHQHTMIRAIFNVSGFDQQLPKIQNACHWQ